MVDGPVAGRARGGAVVRAYLARLLLDSLGFALVALVWVAAGLLWGAPLWAAFVFGALMAKLGEIKPERAL